jgi:choline kinase
LSQVKDCLIVAAGKGTRLKGCGDLKPLVSLCGMPLIEHAMLTAACAGAQNFVVVTGYKGYVLYHCLQGLRTKRGWNITIINNPDFEKENGLSVLLGESALHGEFFLAMCDHVVETSLYEKLLGVKLPKDAVALGVDRRLSNADVDLEDVTKVQISGDKMHGIGKNLKTYNAFDTGVFRANPALFSAIRQSQSDIGDCSISGGMRVLAKKGRALAIDIGASRWIDVDSPEMLQKARDWIQHSNINGTVRVGSLMT